MLEKEFQYELVEVLCGDLKIAFLTDESIALTEHTGVHMHSLWELFYLREGAIKLKMDEEQYELKNNQLLLIPPNIYHSTEVSSSAIKKSVFFAIDKTNSLSNESLYAEVKRVLGGSKVFKIEDGYYLGTLIEAILENQTVKKIGQRWRVNAKVVELVFSLYDILKDDVLRQVNEETIQTTYRKYMYSIERMLDLYYMTNISLEEFSAKFFMSPQNMTKIISKAYGKSFNDLKRELKIRNARKLLRETILSVKEVGESVGYTTTRGFLMAFQKYEGCTPSEYRNAMKQKERDSL